MANRSNRPAIEFWSSTECGAFLNALTCELAAKGWPAEQLFEITQASYWAARTRLARWRMRLSCYGMYPARLAFAFALGRRKRLAVVCTNTFYAPWCALAAARGRVPVVHWVFDLFPDVLTSAEVLKSGSIAERGLRRLVRATFDRSAANVFLGRQLLRYAKEKFGPIPRARVIPIGADGAPFREAPPRRREPGSIVAATQVLYCGNFGRMHDVQTLVAAIAEGLPERVVLRFCGNGAGLRALERASAQWAAVARVTFEGNLAESEWIAAMKAAEVALVTMRSGAEGLVVPSKTYSALVAGQAILAVCPENSDLAELVREHDCGWIVAPGDVIGMRVMLKRLGDEPDEVFAKRSNAWRAGHRHFDQKAIAIEWAELLESVCRENNRIL